MSVVVVGGGLIGSAIAFTLRDAGLKVEVLDAGLPGAAWRAAAGLLTPDGERLYDTPLQADALASLRLWPDFARRLEGHSGQSVHLRPGVVHTGPGQDGEDPAPRCVPGEGRLHPQSVVRAALTGVEVMRARVLGVRPERYGVTLQTDAGERRAAGCPGHGRLERCIRFAGPGRAGSGAAERRHRSPSTLWETSARERPARIRSGPARRSVCGGNGARVGIRAT